MKDETYACSIFHTSQIQFNDEVNEYKERLIFLSENTAPLCSEDESNLHEDN